MEESARSQKSHKISNELQQLSANTPKESIFSKTSTEGQENTGTKNKNVVLSDNKPEVPKIDLNLGQNKSLNEGLNKINTPVVLRHDPKALQSKEDPAATTTENKSQAKSGFKLTHRVQRAEEDPAPVKKLKTEVINPIKSSSPQPEKP